MDLRVGDRAYLIDGYWTTITEIHHCVHFRYPCGGESAAVTGEAFLLVDHEPLHPEDRVVVRRPIRCADQRPWADDDRLAIVLNHPTAGEPNAYVELSVILKRAPIVLSEPGWCRPWQIVEVQHGTPAPTLSEE